MKKMAAIGVNEENGSYRSLISVNVTFMQCRIGSNFVNPEETQSFAEANFYSSFEQGKHRYMILLHAFSFVILLYVYDDCALKCRSSMKP
jgi:hypothetical protein